MSEEEGADSEGDKAEKWTRRVKEEEIIDWFDEVGASHKCPMCSHVGWSLISSEDAPAAAIQIVRPNARPRGRHIPVIPLICERCGYVRMHAYGAFRRWAASKEGKNG